MCRLFEKTALQLAASGTAASERHKSRLSRFFKLPSTASKAKRGQSNFDGKPLSVSRYVAFLVLCCAYGFDSMFVYSFAAGSQLVPCSRTVHVWSDDILQPSSGISAKACAVSISALMLAGNRAGRPSILVP